MPRAPKPTDSPPGQSSVENHPAGAERGPFLKDPQLKLLADAVLSTEQERIRLAHRVWQATERLPLGHQTPEKLLPPAISGMSQVLDLMEQAENAGIKLLERHMKTHPLWVHYGEDTVGIGRKQLGRLLAVIGDPFWLWSDYEMLDGTKVFKDRARSVSELWSYCGMAVTDGHSPRRSRGEQSAWNDQARTRVVLIAKQQIKIMTSPYRAVYDEAKTKYLEQGHTNPCPTCKGGAKENPAGSPISPGHADARAVRIVAKSILKDLWLTARQLHIQAGYTDDAATAAV